jgi:hypothetical protein
VFSAAGASTQTTLDAPRSGTSPSGPPRDVHQQWDPLCLNVLMLGGMTLMLFGGPEAGGLPRLLGAPDGVTRPAALAGAAVMLAGCIGQWRADRSQAPQA